MDDNRNLLLNEDFIKWRLFRMEEEDAKWERFRLDNPHLRQSLDDAIAQFDAVSMNKCPLPDSENAVLFSSIVKNINRHKRRARRMRIGWAAAAVLLVAVVSTVLVRPRPDNEPAVPPAESDRIAERMTPEEEIYILSGKEKISIANKSDIELTENKKALITDSLQSRKELSLPSSSINRLVVPFGKRSTLTLADGSKIWLNSGTQVDFPSEFTAKTREIRVNGEIYIEVARDDRKPFVVHAGDMDVQVYGTAFNISSYDDDDKKTVVLVRGKVKVKTPESATELLPNQKAEFENGRLTKEQVDDVSQFICWTQGVLQFNETPVAEILKKIGRYYNVQFNHTPDVPVNDRTCSGKLFLSNNLDSVMSSVSALSATKYHRENNMIHISKK